MLGKYTNTNLKHGSYRLLDYDPKACHTHPTSWASVKRVYGVTSRPLVVTLVFTRDVLDTGSGLSVELFP